MTFTIDELNALLNLIDLAVRQGGIQTAEVAVPIVAKMRVMAGDLERDLAEPTEEGHA